MAYLITKSDGTILTTVSDGQIDVLSTDLTLIGRNYSGFGESLNENFVKLLENFAGTSRPVRPVRGQIWFDTTESKLKVYNGTAFQPVSSATISDTLPTTLTTGDLWFNNTDKQLYFFDGVDTLLLGPSYTTGQGLSGLRVNTILDTLNQNKVITSLYNNGTLVGIFSSNSIAFTPKVPIPGFTGTIKPGFTPGTIEGFKFDVTSTRAENIIKPTGEVKTADQIVYSNESGIINGTLGVTGTLIVGERQGVQLLEVGGDLLLRNTSQNQLLRISAKRGDIQDDVVIIEPASLSFKIYDGFINSETSIGGNLTVSGNLTVLGDIVSVEVATLRVENKLIELGITTDSSVITNEQAEGGGMILRATEDKEFIWNGGKRAWVSSENIDLTEESYFSIDGTPLLRKNGNTFQLTDAVTIANGIEIFGTQSEFTVDSIYINTNRISTQNSAVLSGLNIDIELEPKGTGNVVLVGSPRITGMADPTADQDAATKNYVDTQLKAKTIVLSLDISDGITNAGIAGWLEQIAPSPATVGAASEYQIGSECKILCSISSNAAVNLNLNSSLVETTGTFVTPGPGTADALTDVSFTTVTVPSNLGSVSITRSVRTFRVQGTPGAWAVVP